jgi:hypothetical protein
MPENLFFKHSLSCNCFALKKKKKLGELVTKLDGHQAGQAASLPSPPPQKKKLSKSCKCQLTPEPVVLDN